MKTYHKVLATAALTAFSGLLFSVTVYGGDDESGGWFGQSRLDVAPVKNLSYQEECGSCHFAYQAGWLPQRSWRMLMGGLSDHFGDNAELQPTTEKQILDYLLANAADRSDYKRSKRIAGSLKQDEVPLRITDTVYFKRKHDEIPARLVRDNKDVASFSNCSACHARAKDGSFSEHEINIPGAGRWDD